MIVYLSTKERFNDDVLSNRIEEKIHNSVKEALGKSVGNSELNSWKNSLRHMDTVLADPGIPQNCGVAVEFNVPGTAKRIDFVLTGKNESDRSVAVIVELKQWQTVESTPMDAVVRTYVGKGMRDLSHPSYQAWSYAMLIEDYNESVRDQEIQLHPCAYLHNCESSSVINAPHYAEHVQRAPAFLRDDAKKLREFIKAHVKHGDEGDVMYTIRDGKIRPSKNLADHLSSLMQGNQEFVMIDDQKVVYETALMLAEASSPNNRNILVVKGGPGTGKSVVAVNLLVELTHRQKVAQYVTKNSAPRTVYESKLTGTITKSRISNLFVGSGGFTATKRDSLNALIVDEAHRLNEKSGMFSNLGENQIKEIASSAPFSVFFLDEDQRIHWKDIGSAGEIRRWARELGATITELELASQFRCNGSNGYLAWLDNLLKIRKTANPTLDGIDYDFRVCESASELRGLIRNKNEDANGARMVAGYCWDWVSKSDKNAFDIELDEGAFKAKWNLTEYGNRWIVAPDSVEEVGCIHTCQGLELEYVGVIVGPDMMLSQEAVVTDGAKRSKMDSSIKGYKKLLRSDPNTARAKAEQLIKNTYKTLMTRGQKGCFVYSPDPDTREFLKAKSSQT